MPFWRRPFGSAKAAPRPFFVLCCSAGFLTLTGLADASWMMRSASRFACRTSMLSTWPLFIPCTLKCSVTSLLWASALLMIVGVLRTQGACVDAASSLCPAGRSGLRRMRFA